MCRGCPGGTSSRPRRNPSVRSSVGAVEATGEYRKIRVRYEGATARMSVVGYATRTKYGRKRRGDIFWAFQEDVEAHPDLFTILANSGGSVVQQLPTSPEGIRIATVPAQPTSIMLADMGLDARILRALASAGHHTADDVDVLSDEQLLAIRGIGKGALTQIRDVLGEKADEVR